MWLKLKAFRAGPLAKVSNQVTSKIWNLDSVSFIAKIGSDWTRLTGEF
jgi:hypothetical protein